MSASVTLLDAAEAQFSRAETLRLLGRYAEAAAAYDRALALRPDHVASWSRRGVALHEMGEFEDAVESFDRALALFPDSAEIHNNRSASLRVLGRCEEALAAADRALTCDPGYARAFNSRGNALRSLGRIEDALWNYERAIAAFHGYGLLRFNRPLPAAGRRFRGGVAGLRVALDHARHEAPQASLRAAPLAGRGAPHGPHHPAPCRAGDRRRAAVLPFRDRGRRARRPCRAGRAARPGATDGKPSGAGADGGPNGEAARLRPALPADGPAAGPGNAPRDDPRGVPYLAAPAGRAKLWRDRLAAPDAGRAEGLRVGIAWSGNPDHADDRNRSLALEALAPVLSVPWARFFCLQRTLRPRDVPEFALHPDLAFFGPLLADFADTAALAAQMDLVISADTAVLHLAGAMGRPTWALLPYAPDWRWMQGRADSPWYPGMRLFRQEAPGDWDGVALRVRAALAALCGRRGAEIF